VKLPNGGRAHIGSTLREYVLDPLHREGRHKARMFASLLGITAKDHERLERAILHAAATSREVESCGDQGHGALYSLRFPMTTPEGRAVVQTVWIVRRGEDFPRLATCFIV
jgi:hypothetical protein